MSKTKKIIFLCISVSILSSIGSFWGAIIIKQLVDSPKMRYVETLGLIWIGTFLFSIIKDYVKQKHFMKEQKIYMGELLKTVFLLPFSFLETKAYNDDFNKIRGKTSQEQSFVSSLESIASTIIGIIGLYILLLPYVSITIIISITILLFLIIFISCFISSRLSNLMYDFWGNYIKNTRKYNYISDVLSNKEYIEEKKVYSFLSFFSNEFDKEFDFASNQNRLLGRKRIKLEFINDVIFLFYSLFAFLILFYTYTKNQITIGLFISATGYMLSLLGGISNAIGTIENITQYKKIIKEHFIFAQNAVEEPKIKNNIMSDSILTLKDIQFKYPTSDKVILENISFSFKDKKKYAIVGINGSGKTTLAKIISGLYPPLSGTITCNKSPAVLFQDFNKYPATLRENIILSENFDPINISKLNIIEQKSGLNKRIKKMNLGDNTELTMLKEGGEELSGGEWQRVALARILWNNSDVFILDEPTASLDPLEEIRIFKAYDKLLKDKTVIFITHRLGFVKDVDEVIVLHEGNIAEVGTHEELLSLKNGIYKNMFEEQRHWYE